VHAREHAAGWQGERGVVVTVIVIGGAEWWLLLWYVVQGGGYCCLSCLVGGQWHVMVLTGMPVGVGVGVGVAVMVPVAVAEPLLVSSEHAPQRDSAEQCEARTTPAAPLSATDRSGTIRRAGGGLQEAARGIGIVVAACANREARARPRCEGASRRSGRRETQ
jgi:hypothetical protein